MATAASERAVELSTVKACEKLNCHCFVDATHPLTRFHSLQFAEPIECPWHCNTFKQKAVHIHMDHTADLRLSTIGCTLLWLSMIQALQIRASSEHVGSWLQKKQPEPVRHPQSSLVMEAIMPELYARSGSPLAEARRDYVDIDLGSWCVLRIRQYC